MPAWHAAKQASTNANGNAIIELNKVFCSMRSDKTLFVLINNEKVTRAMGLESMVDLISHNESVWR